MSNSHNITWHRLPTHAANANAVMPYKASPRSAGYDLTAIRVQRLVGDVWMLRTGIAVTMPPNTWMMLAARSSLFKYNLMIANGVGIIDNDYQGEICGLVTRLDKDAPVDFDALMPFRFGQLIPIPEGSYDDLYTNRKPTGESDRGEGGFGSTG